MKLVFGAGLVACGSIAGASGLEDRDRAAIEALEKQLPGRPGPDGARPSPSLPARMAEVFVPAVSIAYFENGRVKWSRAFGRTAAGSDRPATTETRFQAASMSKAVSAAAALRLVDRGVVGLDEDVRRRLRAWRLPAAGARGAVTLRRLLSHTAGLTVEGYPGYQPGQPVPTIAESLSGSAPSNTPAVRIATPPGSAFAYSGGGYSVVQLLVDEAAKGGFSDVVRRELLRPLGMGHSTFDRQLDGPPRHDVAHGHGASGTPVPGGGHVYPELAAAGLWTTPSDYARFLIALQDSWAKRPNALLKPATAHDMMTPVLENYGLGVRIMERGGRRAITHAGANEGFVSQFVAHLDGAREGVVVMTNGDNGGALIGPILATLDRHYGWARQSPEARPSKAVASR